MLKKNIVIKNKELVSDKWEELLLVTLLNFIFEVFQ